MTTEKPMYLIDENKNLIGVCTHSISGWRFLPHNVARKPGRVPCKSPAAAIPKWAFDALDDVLTLDEWKALKAAQLNREIG